MGRARAIAISTLLARSFVGVAPAFTTACSSGSATSPEAGVTLGSVEGNALSGTYAFPVNYAVIDTQLPRDQCGFDTALDGGAYASFALWLSDVDIYNDAGGMLAITPSPSHILSIQVAGPSYTSTSNASDVASPTPIAPGVYAIGFEDADDDELCGLPPGGSATLDRYDFAGDAGAYTQATALSGSVTVTSLGSGRIAGKFNVELGAIVYGAIFIDTQHPIPFSGTFVATGM